MTAETATRTVPVIGAARRLATALARVRRRRLARRPGRAGDPAARAAKCEPRPP
jgi:hypothetical protein